MMCRRKQICIFLLMAAIMIIAGCGQKKGEDPVTVTLWHVYGGQTESPLNNLIDEFNETVGKEENIRICGSMDSEDGRRPLCKNPKE